MRRDEKRSRNPAILATGMAAAGAAVLIFLPRLRKAVAGTLETVETTCRRFTGAAETPAGEVETTGEETGKRIPSPKSGTTKSTSPGHVNPKSQKVIRRVGKSPSWKGQYTYELECLECGHRYGAPGPQIEAGDGRECPKCQGGAPGDPVRA